jgi:hypothetical protein
MRTGRGAQLERDGQGEIGNWFGAQDIGDGGDDPGRDVLALPGLDSPEDRLANPWAILGGKAGATLGALQEFRFHVLEHQIQFTPGQELVEVLGQEAGSEIGAHGQYAQVHRTQMILRPTVEWDVDDTTTFVDGDHLRPDKKDNRDFQPEQAHSCGLTDSKGDLVLDQPGQGLLSFSGFFTKAGHLTSL